MLRLAILFFGTFLYSSADAQLLGSTVVNESATTLPSNYTLYGITKRSVTIDGENGAFVTCDSSEFSVGVFCEELENYDNAPNALLTGGALSARTGVCLWKNRGRYVTRNNCLAFKAIVGNSNSGSYSKQLKLEE